MAVFPVPILKGVIPKISDSYGYSENRGRVHPGADIMYRRESKGTAQLPVFSPFYYMPTGVPALAYDAGRVTRAGMIGTGGRVEIDHGGGLKTKYYHLRSPKVRAGQTVKAGQPVGDIYHNVSGYRLNHLHFEMIKNGSKIDPAPYLANAQKVEAPSTAAFLGKVGIAAVAGVLISKYVFK
jgi:murein DD-endopeptidase MepM/ murein hydrolase activator NlpD